MNRHETHLMNERRKKLEQEITFLTLKLSRKPEPFSDEYYDRQEDEAKLDRLKEELALLKVG